MHFRKSIATTDAVAGNACYICGYKDREDKHGPLVDTGQIIDFEGRLVICAGCVGGMASMLGWITPEDAQDLQSELEKVETDLFQTRMRLGKAEKALSALRSYEEEKSAVSSA